MFIGNVLNSQASRLSMDLLSRWSHIWINTS